MTLVLADVVGQPCEEGKYGVGREERRGERGVFSQIRLFASRPLGSELAFEAKYGGI
jgi:hypothetical protein